MSIDGGNADPGDKESYGEYSVDDEDQPAAEDLLLDDSVDEADRGYSPPEHYSAAQGYGNTPWEEEHRETIDQRERQEIPEEDPYEAAERESVEDIERDSTNAEVGDERAGRLVAPDEGAHEDTEKDLVGLDAGIDGAAASAEEAAVHVVDGTDDTL